MAIALHKTLCYKPEDDVLKGKSKFWGFPDLPYEMEFPYKGDEPLCFICQINIEELRSQITQTQSTDCLPQRGMLYFFAQIDYFLGWTDEFEEGIGPWGSNSFRVLYAENVTGLHTHKTYFEDGIPAAPDTWGMEFTDCEDNAYGHKLLGHPFFEEVPSKISLLQIDEDDDWNLRFFDSGMLNFIIDEKSLKKQDFSKTGLYFHSL